MSTVATPTRPRKASKPVQRFARVLERPTADTPGLLRLTVAGKPQVYWLQEIRCDIGGRGYELRKFGDRASDPYHVRTGRQPSCDCKGHLRWHHCKHAESLTALEASGKV
jgi:hypothetical protein